MSVPAQDLTGLGDVAFKVLKQSAVLGGPWGHLPQLFRQLMLLFSLLDLQVAFDIVCENVGRDWRRLARELKLSEAKIDGIEEKYPRHLNEQVRETLRVWKNAERGNASVAGLVKALRACRLNLVADKVEEASMAQGSVSKNEDMSPGLGDSTVSSSETF